MTADDPNALALRLRAEQGVALEAERLREPAATARAIGALAGRAQEVLPFGAEPSGFALALAALRRTRGAS